EGQPDLRAPGGACGVNAADVANDHRSSRQEIALSCKQRLKGPDVKLLILAHLLGVEVAFEAYQEARAWDHGESLRRLPMAVAIDGVAIGMGFRHRIGLQRIPADYRGLLGPRRCRKG